MQVESLGEFIGDGSLIGSVRRAIIACGITGKPFPHSLLIGPSGFGKTALVNAIARELSVKMHYLLCDRDLNRQQLAMTFRSVNMGDMIFLDEVHALRPETLELCYQAMDRLVTLEERYERDQAQEWTAIAPLAIVAATDRVGDIRPAFRRRCVNLIFLTKYSRLVLKEMAVCFARTLDLLIDDTGLDWLARACRGNPRTLRLMLERLSPHSFAMGSPEWGKAELVKFYGIEGIGEDGMTHIDREYLCLLERQDRPCGVEASALALGLDARFLRTDIEPFLVNAGLIAITPRGRELTRAGKQKTQKGDMSIYV